MNPSCSSGVSATSNSSNSSDSATDSRTNSKSNADETVPSRRSLFFLVDNRIFMLVMTILSFSSFFAGFRSSELERLAHQQAILQEHYQQRQEHHRLYPEAPLGQHLMVDMSHVDTAFLQSEERLLVAMTETARDVGLTGVSHECLATSTRGRSCVGILSEASYIAVQTWPSQGALTVDLFVSESPTSLLPQSVETMARVFGIPKTGDSSASEDDTCQTTETDTCSNEAAAEKVRVTWSHELRGFRDEAAQANTAIGAYSDLNFMILSPMDMFYKKHVYSSLTPWNRIDMWDSIEVCCGACLVKYSRWMALFIYSSGSTVDFTFFFPLINTSVRR